MLYSLVEDNGLSNAMKSSPPPPSEVPMYQT